ncbi:MAG: CPBP family intramembrane metalloprotease [Propionibacteriales bacterium]|nr:CPBP family intramembrane metalloprotease [Propionibacteriales bacterium]
MSSAPHSLGVPPPGPPPSVAGPPPALPVQSREYHHFWRAPRSTWWKALLAMVLLLIAFFALQAVAGAVGVLIDVATGTSTLDSLDTFTVTPAIFLALNLSLGAMIPISMWLAWAFTGQRPGWLSSVEGRFRWRWMTKCLIIVLPVYLLYVGIGTAVGGPFPGPLQPNAILLLIMVLLTTPFQCAGEEYAVRGLLVRGVSSWISRPLLALVTATLLTGLLFASGHPNLDVWKVLGLLVFASMASILTWRTGGLEAACLAHTANNMLLMVPAALWGDFTALLNANTPGTPLAVGLELIVAALVIGGVEWLARRSRIARTSAPGREVADAIGRTSQP